MRKPEEKTIVRPAMLVKTAVRAGYRPVHGLVYPDQSKKWVSGWFDLDSKGLKGVADIMPPPPPR